MLPKTIAQCKDLLQVYGIYLFALRIAVSYSWLYSVREIWFVSTCHSRQGNSCVRAPLRSRSNLDWALFSKFSAWTPRLQRVEFVYR